MEREPARRFSWRIAILVILLACVLAVAVLIRHGSARAFPLRDGSTLEWVGLTVGTNVLLDGSPIEKLLRDLIPSNGISVFSLSFNRPVPTQHFSDADATAWIRLRGPKLDPSEFKFHWEGTRVIARNHSGRELVNPPPRPHRTSSNEVLLAIPLHAFPRNEETVQLRISPPVVNNQTREWVELEFKNPLQRGGLCWNVLPLPATNVIEQAEFVLASAREGEIGFRLPSNGWTLVDCRIWDEEGNTALLSQRSSMEGLKFASFPYSLETNRPWKVSATFLRASKFPLPMNDSYPDEDKRFVSLSVTAAPVMLTNLIGERFFCSFDGFSVEISREDRRARPYWGLLSATNEFRMPVSISRWSRSLTAQHWLLEHACHAVDLELACPPLVQTEFYIHPGRRWTETAASVE